MIHSEIHNESSQASRTFRNSPDSAKTEEIPYIDDWAGNPEELIREFIPTIKFLALRLSVRVPSGLNVDDLISVGTLGLLDAISKFDSTRKIKFRTYAEFRIRGAMLDEIRAMDWVPRSIRKRIRRIQQGTTKYIQRNLQPPTEAELAAELDMNVEELNKVLLQANSSVLLSLEDFGIQEDDTQSLPIELVDRDQPTPLESLLSEDTRRILVSSINRLPKRLRLVLTLYHFEELTMKEIGTLLNVTESRICQLHAQAMIRLRSLLHWRMPK